MLNVIRPAIVSFVALTVVTGVIYPAIVTGIAKVAFAKQAEGSLIEQDGKIVGSTLIAQPFTDAKYFWPRPSAAGANGYDATSGSGSNLGPSNPALADAVKGRIAALQAADPGNVAPVPVDLVTASGSGLDPHESVAAARYQLARVAKARGLSTDAVDKLVADATETPLVPTFGPPAVNVLRLNLMLDRPSAATMASVATATAPSDVIAGARGDGFAPASR